MDESPSYQFKYNKINQVENPIGIEGMRKLGKAYWPHLTNVYQSLFSIVYCFDRAHVRKSKVLFGQKVTL